MTMEIKVSEVVELHKKIKAFNATPISEIVFLDDTGNRLDVSLKTLDNWRFTGLNNMDFVINLAEVVNNIVEYLVEKSQTEKLGEEKRFLGKGQYEKSGYEFEKQEKENKERNELVQPLTEGEGEEKKEDEEEFMHEVLSNLASGVLFNARYHFKGTQTEIEMYKNIDKQIKKYLNIYLKERYNKPQQESKEECKLPCKYEECIGCKKDGFHGLTCPSRDF